MAEVKSDRRQALELAIAQIERQFGKGSIMRLGAGGPLEEIAVIPTGALSLDVALGVGGLPRGRVTEIYGPESSGKTTLGLHVIAEAQRLGGIAAFIDAEHALDPIYAKKLGVNTDELLISQPDTGEQALEIAETLVRSNSVDVIVVDSVAALVPRAELDGDMGDSLPGLQARLMSQALRKLTAAISRSGAVLDAGVEQSIIEKSGTWYTYKNERIGQGRENAKKWLQENPATLADLEAKIREALGLRPAALSK